MGSVVVIGNCEVTSEHDYLRKRLLSGFDDSPVGGKAETIDVLRQSEWSAEFEQLMRNRLLMGRFRYGRMDDPAKGDYDCIKSALSRLRKYQETGNLEHLVDVANLCLVEFVHGRHPNKHFEAADDGEHVEKL